MAKKFLESKGGFQFPLTVAFGNAAENRREYRLLYGIEQADLVNAETKEKTSKTYLYVSGLYDGFEKAANMQKRTIGFDIEDIAKLLQEAYENNEIADLEKLKAPKPVNPKPSGL